MTVGKDVSGFVPGDIVVGLLDSSGLQEVITLPDYYADVVYLLAVFSIDSWTPCTVEPDLITAKMLAFPSKSSRNKNDSNLAIS